MNSLSIFFVIVTQPTVLSEVVRDDLILIKPSSQQLVDF